MWNWVKNAAGGIIGGVGSVVGSLIGASSAKEINKQKAAQADQLFKKQKQETDTSHQREVEDLRAAGLNPILSAKYGGSASAQGVMPDLKNPYQDAGRDFSSASQIAIDRQVKKVQIQNTKAQTKNISQSEKNAYALTRINSARSIQEQLKVERMIAEQPAYLGKWGEYPAKWSRFKKALPEIKLKSQSFNPN